MADRGTMTGRARRYVMIGAPVRAVRTPGMLEARMAAASISASVEIRHVEPEDLGSFMREAREDLRIDGLMVTMPHKRAMVGHLAQVSSTAALIGSVNAVKRLPSGEMVGAQFDGIAMLRALSKAGYGVSDARILLAGFGGAGRAIAHAILHEGCGHLSVCDTALDRRTIEAELFRLAGGADGNISGRDGRKDCRILVNATPLGMTDGDPSPFSAEQIAAADCVADIVADPADTQLARMTSEAGATLVTGRAMVAAQIDPIFHWLESMSIEQ